MSSTAIDYSKEDFSAFRDLPKSFSDFFSAPAARATNEITLGKQNHEISEQTLEEYEEHMTEVNKMSRFHKYLPIFTTGAGLFSEGYINNSIGIASTCLSALYPKEYKHSHAIKNVSSIAFVGIVVGQLSFGYISDYYSRKAAMLWGTSLLVLFTILCSGAWGAHGSVGGMLAAITAYRFFMGIGIGSEYPSGSAACAEASSLLPPGKRNRYFAIFTNFMIDSGFVISAFVPMVLLWIFTPKHLTIIWRLTIGLGAIPPISLFILRLYYTEGKTFQKTKLNSNVPYLAIIKFYWFRLFIIAIIWFIYDLCAYGFGIFSSYIIAELFDSADMYKVFGWNVVFNLFYIPGAFLGAYSADYFGPRITLVVGVTLQSIIGFILAGCFESALKHIGGFTVAYGIFMTLGEFGPGDCIGLLASKTSATPIRGQYYGIAAAIGKVGAFIGTYCFTPLTDKHGVKSAYWLASSLGIFSAILAYFFLPAVDQGAMQREDAKFIAYLKSINYDVSQLGVHDGENVSVDEEDAQNESFTEVSKS
ncbi:hypothetical protein WICPIJ_009877 [Wickerhamomyces pijperi]|uniref:Major facilitator superfamily (MFS) profile domain-containing protein n=1 Tax=Wickerhamomyces pijperi TaxID=599730 RepID=A0A9P8TC27_WICPI|nr:hypothetical protein WICPIJ_009877 [Wickerhamomyces pijperi]